MRDTSIVKLMYMPLVNFHNAGHHIWVTGGTNFRNSRKVGVGPPLPGNCNCTILRKKIHKHMQLSLLAKGGKRHLKKPQIKNIKRDEAYLLRQNHI